MRNTAAIALGLLLAAAPAHAFGPGGLARQFSSAVPSSEVVGAISYASARHSCGECAVMPFARLTPTASDAGRFLAALGMGIAPFAVPAAESADAGVLTGSVPSGEPL
ncbi:hypothetical protein NOF55_06400 [Rhizobiaceae bacterium BDR2-2]|uniref:Uncharacterized protein n=1 Tax=Ectorhizobium quercum TaxID=2965071 RepID=A0AAE3MYK9_9HYPH|nr:hypothetical protein [Ectorhizobium quercum]MCX8996732.1 hypothetical protein [Ectorhizobium quercum]